MKKQRTKRHNCFRDGKIHVMAKLCKTCIFRPANPIGLRSGRVKQMIADAEQNQSAIVCHSTLGTSTNAVCRGFFERHATLPLKLAVATGDVEFQREEKESDE